MVINRDFTLRFIKNKNKICVCVNCEGRPFVVFKLSPVLLFKVNSQGSMNKIN